MGCAQSTPENNKSPSSQESSNQSPSNKSASSKSDATTPSRKGTLGNVYKIECGKSKKKITISMCVCGVLFSIVSKKKDLFKLSRC